MEDTYNRPMISLTNCRFHRHMMLMLILDFVIDRPARIGAIVSKPKIDPLICHFLCLILPPTIKYPFVRNCEVFPKIQG
jgi:hypothetical protein